MHYGDLYLGKTTVLAKDTPAFIANRIGVFGIMAIFHLVERLGLTIDEVETLTGPLIGRPKSATFRTADVVGIDTLVKVAKGVHQACPQDEARSTFETPAWLEQLLKNSWLGDKTGHGFFKKLKGGGDKEILTLDLKTMEYGPRQKPKWASADSAKAIDDLPQRLKLLTTAQDKAGEFLRHFHYGLFSYISHRIPEISDEVYRIDDAMMAGFGWEIGAFESWDVLGVERTTKSMKEAGYPVAPWVNEMLAAGNKTFYKVEGGKRLSYDPGSRTYKALPGAAAFVILKNNREVWKNNSCQVFDIGDDVLGLQWNTKMNSIGGEVLSGITKAVELAEGGYKGLVIANEGLNFSAGANVGMIFMLAVEQEWDELHFAVKLFQNTMMRVRYSAGARGGGAARPGPRRRLRAEPAQR
jgi:3-hydroxyacyl-CoA dehydrogenase